MKRKNFAHITMSAAIFIFTISTLPDPTRSLGVNDSDQHENGSEQESVSGQIVNSTYLTISGVTFNQTDNTINMTGTIANNSTFRSFSNVVIVGQLYDKENRLITATSSLAATANLHPKQQSTFTIITNLPNHEEVVRYTISPSGFPVK
jgi:hypothetical protein